MIDKTTSRVIMGLLGTACVLITAFAWYKTKYAAVPEAGMPHNIYDEDIPRSAPVPVDYRMVLLTPQELAKAPLADVFTSPLGDENGAFTYVAQGVGDMNAARKGRHAGQDLNGIGGENTDEGLPVRAAGRGLLIYAGEPSSDWGNVVVLLHRLPDGRFVQSLYAHLKTVSDIPLGTLVGLSLIHISEATRPERISYAVFCLKKIGSVGTAHGNYLAHLHFEMIESIAHEAGMPGYGKTTFNRINPDEVLKQYAPDPEMMMPDPIIALKQVQMAAGWEKLLENLYKDNSMEALDKILPGSQPSSEEKEKR